jgi:hypothetical protein
MRLKRFLSTAAVAAVLMMPSAVLAENVAVSVDVSAATAVLDAVRNPRLTTAEALKIAQLPGNQGLIRKAKSYGRTATDALFAQALVAASHQNASFVDVSRFRFSEVREHAAQTEQAIAGLRDPRLHLLDAVKARIAAFTPKTLKGQVTGYLVVGGTSGGFAFGEPQFYLNLDRFPSAVLASTIMEHELFHAVQALARSAHEPTETQTKCIAGTAHGSDVADVFGSLLAEGTASYVGDVLSLAEHGTDAATTEQRVRVARNVGLVDRSITQLELSVHGLTTGAAVSPREVYELGFYGDEVLYALGYVMARAIASEQGSGEIGELISMPGAAFVERYIHLKGYGKSEAMPALKPGTIAWANKLSACSRSVPSAHT